MKNTQIQRLKGVFPALVTPFDEQDKVNTDALRQIIRLGIRNGAGGFYVGGSTGEAFLLTLEERKTILETVIDEARDYNQSVIAHIGCISTSQATELAVHAQDCGADAISSVAPFYYKYSFEEIKRYYLDITDKCSLPLVIYNIPVLSGVEFNITQMKELIDIPQVIGIKHTSSDYFALDRYKNLREGLLIYNGFDEMFLSGLSMGADGGIGSTYNFMADRFVRIQNFYNAGNMTAALAEQKSVNNIIQALIKVGVIPGVKAILEVMGIPAGQCRRPFGSLGTKEKQYLHKVFCENT